MIQPKSYRLLRKILVFAILWFLFGLIYVVLEFGLLGKDLNYYPATGNNYNPKMAFIVTPIGAFFIGIIQGFIEVKWLKKVFESKPLWYKVLLKSTFYLLFITLFLLSLVMLNSIFLFKEGKIDQAIWNDLTRFAGSFSFWSVIIYIAFTLNFALIYSEITNYMGNNVFYNFLFGRYHHPNQEIRIFMFLDMKGSTTIAEGLGHRRYFDLIKAYYKDMTDAILATSGEIYQYVGDEIVISWKLEKGIQQNNCIECFKKIEKSIQKNADYYKDSFGLIPEYKAGLHLGEVTTGEIGIIKKDIIYTGDVLNTTARIQSECNNYNAKILLSRSLLEKLNLNDTYKIERIGEIVLRGKAEAMPLYKLDW